MNFSRIGVIGAGTMGNGIAQICAAAGMQVVMVDVSDAALARGMGAMGASLERLVKKDKLQAAERAALLARVRTTTDYAQLSAADIVIGSGLKFAVRLFKMLPARPSFDRYIERCVARPAFQRAEKIAAG